MGGIRKRGSNQAVGLALAVAMVLVATACQNWAQYMGHPNLDGNASPEHTINRDNVDTLREAYRIDLGHPDGVSLTPVVSDGVIYATTAAADGSDLRLTAALEGKSRTCSGSPATCRPLWTAVLPDPPDVSPSPPIVANQVVYVSVGSSDVRSGTLLAFDARGSTNCGGIPKTCQPLWTAPTGGAFGVNVDGGHLFAVTTSLDGSVFSGQLQAYDAAGNDGCSGSPKVCQPLWTADILSLSVPSIAEGRIYLDGVAGSRKGLVVYDESGVTNCGGAPKVCQPLFTGPIRAGSGSVAVSGGVAYMEVQSPSVANQSLLLAYDADGSTKCASGVCQPLWTAVLTGTAFFNTPAVAGGRVYAMSSLSNSTTDSFGVIDSFDAAGISGCSGTPRSCTPFMTALDSSGSDIEISPTLANGVLYAGGRAFDATGTRGCTEPASGARQCGALWNGANTFFASLATIVDGQVILGGNDGFVHIYALP